MDDDVVFFFQGHEEVLPIYEKLEGCILKNIENVQVRVQKSQISFYNRHLFACVSFMRLGRKKDFPQNHLVLAFGLDRRMESPWIEAEVEPYPARWTHHLILSSSEEVDDELLSWLKMASMLAERKR